MAKIQQIHNCKWQNLWLSLCTQNKFYDFQAIFGIRIYNNKKQMKLPQIMLVTAIIPNLGKII